MDLSNDRNDSYNSTQKEIEGKVTEEDTNNIHNGLNILAGIIARDIYDKQKGNISSK